MKYTAVTIVAGPCSVDENNIKEIYEISEMTVKNSSGKEQKAIAGTRVVGMKSRTELSTSGKGMGMDCEAYMKNLKILTEGGSINDMEIPPSAIIAEEIYKKTNMIIATEVMSPLLQLTAYEGKIPKNKLLPWNPAVNQLGWQVLEMATYAKRNGWHIGIKNPKWVGEHLHTANSAEFKGKTTMEKTWSGIATYAAGIEGETMLIHRGVDVPDKGDYRNMPVHEIAKRTKLATPGAKLYFDPSHSYGPKMVRHIVGATIEAMKMKINDEEYLYDGILVEAGTSTTDTEQHITLVELREMAREIATFRDLVCPE